MTKCYETKSLTTTVEVKPTYENKEQNPLEVIRSKAVDCPRAVVVKKV